MLVYLWCTNTEYLIIKVFKRCGLPSTFSHHPSLASIALSTSSWWHTELMNLSFCGQPTLVCPCVRVHRRMSQLHPYFSNSSLHVLCFLLEWFMRWDVSGHISAVLLGADSRIYSKHPVASLCCSHLAFSSRVLLESLWCNYSVVLSQLQLRRIPALLF